MQTPVRYYIVQTDDQPVVRSIPVTKRPTTSATEEHASPPAAAPAQGEAPGRTKVARLMRAAKRRTSTDQ